MQDFPTRRVMPLPPVAWWATYLLAIPIWAFFGLAAFALVTRGVASIDRSTGLWPDALTLDDRTISLLSTMAPPIAILIFVLAAIALAVHGVIRFRYWTHNRVLKVDRNKFAADLVTLVHAGQRSAPPFTLFLRPFFSEAARWSDDQFDIANFRHGNGLEWDVSLADAFDHLAPSVKIGGKSSRLNNAPGAGIVRVSDDNWQSTFLSLLSSCKYAVITPVMQPATAWEIEQAITREDLKKCIFFLPPLTLVDFADVPVLGRLFGSLGPGDYKADPSIRSFQDAWTHSRTILAARGLLLPDLGRFGFFARRTDVGEIRVVHLKTQDRVLSDEALDAVKLLLVD